MKRRESGISNRESRVISRGERETERIAARFARTLRGGDVILLEGELGAGKTAFVRGLARGLGVRDRITSPTFVLMRVHRVWQARASARGALRRVVPRDGRSGVRHLVHVDAYRVRDPREFEAIGLFEWIGRPDTVVAIEWGERVRALPTSSHIHRVRMVVDRHSFTRRRIAISCVRPT